MKIKKTVTLSKDDVKILLNASVILRAVNDVCWTPDNILEFVQKKPSSKWDVSIEWEE